MYSRGHRSHIKIIDGVQYLLKDYQIRDANINIVMEKRSMDL